MWVCPEEKDSNVFVSTMTIIYFFYGLSFFTMGIVITQEIGRCSDERLRHGLLFLAAFGLLHGGHEWLEMFQGLGVMPGGMGASVWLGVRVILLAFSFLLLGIFGVTLLTRRASDRRLSLLVPIGLAGIWSFGLLIMRPHFVDQTSMWDMIDVWTRYILAIPASLLACAGLIYQQYEFRRIGMAQFGRDSLWAAIAFAWYGLIGQLFTRPSSLPPSTFLNSVLFMKLFGFPIQLLRAFAALVTAVFVSRFLRSFQVETQQKIDDLQAARLEEAQRRQALRGELLKRVVDAQEAERQRIARELHDETGQSLTAIGLGLRGAITLLRQDAEKAIQNLRELERLVNRSLDELQRVITGLRPSHLDDLGLGAALRWYCNDIQKRFKLPINVEIVGEAVEMDTEVKTTVFRVAQEAIGNVVKHADAKNIKVRLGFQDNVVVLDVDDDGKGFDIASLEKSARKSWGLLGMEERVSLFGGKLTIQSRISWGTHVTAVIPYRINPTEEVGDDHTPVAG